MTTKQSKRPLRHRKMDRPRSGTDGTAQATFEIALCQHRTGRPAEVGISCRGVLSVLPHHVDSLNLLGMIARQDGRLDDAMTLIRQAIMINGEAAGFHSNLGNASLENKQFDEAFACFRTAFELDPRFIEARINLGCALSDVGQVEQAIQHFRHAIVIDPRLALAHSNLGDALRLLAQQEKPDEAIPWFLKAIASRPHHVGTYNNLGKTLMDQGNVAQAISCFGYATALDPNYCDAHLNRARPRRHTVRSRRGVARSRTAGRCDHIVRTCCRVLHRQP